MGFGLVSDGIYPIEARFLLHDDVSTGTSAVFESVGAFLLLKRCLVALWTLPYGLRGWLRL